MENALIYKFQSGFLPGHSTTHQLIDLSNEIFMTLDNLELICLILFDVSKAFDRVWLRGYFDIYFKSVFTMLHKLLIPYEFSPMDVSSANNLHKPIVSSAMPLKEKASQLNNCKKYFRMVQTMISQI
jgi:hypothetical protein